MRPTSQPALFTDVRHDAPSRKTRRQLAETHPVVAEYCAAWQREYGRPLRLPSFAETAHHAKRLAALIDDADIREAFLAAYLSDRSPFLVRTEHALRYAITTTSFSKYRRIAEYAVAERRRFQQATPPRAPEQPVAYRRFGRQWFVDAWNSAGALISTHAISAVDESRALAVATAWWLREAPWGIHRVTVREGAHGAAR